tara:strand:+ start:7447 stop:9927 length:2481 start_codon:yes stop_codon:yes gene_type:complete
MTSILYDKNFNDNESYNQIFKKYPFELSNFQKWAIKGIVSNVNVLITAHTGSGKTLPAEAAIEWFIQKNKKVIYCSPIKALSNEKFHNFSEKFPNISFGILTGDIKYNPEAQVLIMTTEILRNNLFKNGEEKNKNILDFEMNFEEELGCVIYDEIHYINDVDRGTVWEESIMLLPNSVQIIGLSATIDSPEHLCNFISRANEKDTWLCPNETRVVPLEHYCYFTAQKNILQKMNKTNRDTFESLINKPLTITNSIDSKFNDNIYHNINKLQKILDVNRLNKINKYYIMNNMIEYLKKNNLLPGLVFVFSRRGCYDYAKKITVPLFEENSKIPSIVSKECKNILIKKLDNWKEYIELDEYIKIVKLLEKGIAVHHSGVTPVFREMIELLFAKGYIKLLFATETFAVGINMPTRSVVFTSLIKYSNNGFRPLYSHEYTQMAGRAGRRGIDVKGYVFHLNNLFINNNVLDITEYKTILTGNSQLIKSKFNINYNLILSLLDSKQSLHSFVKNSLLNNEIISELKYSENELVISDKKIQDYKIKLNQLLKTEYDDAETWYNIENKIIVLKQNVYKKKKNAITKKYGSFDNIKHDIKLMNTLKLLISENNKIKISINNSKNYIDNLYNNHLEILMNQQFIDETQCLSTKGLIAYNIQEIPGISFTTFLYKLHSYNKLNIFTSKDFISFFSIFTSIRIQEQYKVYDINSINISNNTKYLIKEFEKESFKYEQLELKYNLNTSHCNLHYDICELVNKWCNVKNEEESLKIFQELEYWGIFLGDFIKAILKINNIALEMEKICEILEDMQLLKIMKEIPTLTLKSVITNQSLYL